MRIYGLLLMDKETKYLQLNNNMLYSKQKATRKEKQYK